MSLCTKLSCTLFDLWNLPGSSETRVLVFNSTCHCCDISLVSRSVGFCDANSETCHWHSAEQLIHNCAIIMDALTWWCVSDKVSRQTGDSFFWSASWWTTVPSFLEQPTRNAPTHPTCTHLSSGKFSSVSHWFFQKSLWWQTPSSFPCRTNLPKS